MEPRNLKFQSTGSEQAAVNASGDAPPSDYTLSGWLNRAGSAWAAASLNNSMLALQKLFGMLLGGIAVGAQVGSVFVCLSILLVGYSFFFRLLPASA
jgi:hypothetical protein